jgi:hypothetical protein
MGGCGLLTVKLKKTSFDAYTELFCGLNNVIIGGIVPGIGFVSLKIIQGFAFATPTTVENINAKIKVAAIVFLFTDSLSEIAITCFAPLLLGAP